MTDHEHPNAHLLERVRLAWADGSTDYRACLTCAHHRDMHGIGYCLRVAAGKPHVEPLDLARGSSGSCGPEARHRSPIASMAMDTIYRITVSDT
jgi:hypothetical protein